MRARPRLPKTENWVTLVIPKPVDDLLATDVAPNKALLHVDPK